MAGLVDELLALQAPKGPACGVGIALDALPPDIDRDELAAVIDNPAIRYSTIAAWAKARGIDLRAEALSRHRNGQCRCRS